MKKSAGVLMYRRKSHVTEVFLVHPGGPFWVRRDSGSWSIPKGEYPPSEDPLDAARREFEEETGFRPEGDFVELPEIKQKGGKLVKAWALEGDLDPDNIKSNTFRTEWPPHSGNTREFPEIDRAAWFPIETAKVKILKSQEPLLGHLRKMLGPDAEPEGKR
jgi:predicted NUDIX family NTP pyrophosphohydrolase